MLKRKRMMMSALVVVAASAMPGCMVSAGSPPEVEDASETEQAMTDGPIFRVKTIPCSIVYPAPFQPTVRVKNTQGLIDDGVDNGKLYYNLGNAQLQIGDLGQAIVSYRRAERLIPNDSNLRENLRFARSLCRNQIPTATGRAARAYHRSVQGRRGRIFLRTESSRALRNPLATG